MLALNAVWCSIQKSNNAGLAFAGTRLAKIAEACRSGVAVRDYRFTPDAQPPCLVSEMSTADILDCLNDGGVVILKGTGDEGTAEDVMERLRIELVVRSLGLSSSRL